MKRLRTGVVILAAGRGTRMNHELPKVIVPVGGLPMILRLLRSVKQSGFFHKPVVVVGSRKELVMTVVGRRATYVTQSRPLGTGQAVLAAKKALYGQADEILVLYGDSPFIRPKTINELIRRRRRARAVIAFSTLRVPNFLGSRRSFVRYGHIVRDDSGRFMQRCVEWKDATRRERAIKELNSGFYCFDAKWLWRSLPKLKKREISGEYYLTDLLGLAVAEKRRVVPVPLKDWREGIGTNTTHDIKVCERFV